MRVKEFLSKFKDVREDFIVTDFSGILVDDVEVDEETKTVILYTEED